MTTAPTKEEIQAEALSRAAGGQSLTNWPAIFAGFIAKGIPEADVTPQQMEEFKVAVSRILTPHASAILLDPEFGLPAAEARAKNAGPRDL